MSLFTNLVKKSLTQFLRRRKKWLIALTIVLGLMIVANYVMRHYVDNVVGDLIREFVHEKSEGFYEVDFTEIAYILNGGRFYMSDFEFRIDPEQARDLDYDALDKKYVYKAQIPHLQIDIIDFWSIIFARKLKVIGIEINSPMIQIINLNKNKTPKKISFEAGNLYSVLSGQLNELKINDFLITDGTFDYQTHKGADYDNFLVKGVTFEVNNFKLNEAASARTDKIFYTDDIFLEISDQLLYLKDSIHKVTFDKFYISTSKNEFGFENFRLTRRENPHANVSDHDHYEVDLPEFRLAGIDFVSAYNNNLLNIDSIQILDPVINITKRTTKAKRDSTKGNLLDLAMVYHDYLEIDHFDLQDAHLIFTDERKEVPKQYSIENISAHLTKVEIDTGSHSKYEYGFNFDEADLMVKDYEVKLPDSLSTVRFDEFSISSNPFEITLKDLTINPDPRIAQAQDRDLLYAKIPYLVISDFDVAEAINMDTFYIEEVYLEEPEISIVTAKGKKQQDTDDKQLQAGGLFGVYAALQDISDYFQLNKMNLVNGKFKVGNPNDGIRNEIALNNIDLTLENLLVDSLTNTESDILGDLSIDLSLKESSVSMPFGDIAIVNMRFQSEEGRLHFKELRVTADSSSQKTKYDLKIPHLLISGIKPNEIVFDQNISLDSLWFEDVDINLDLIAQAQTPQEPEAGEKQQLPSVAIKHFVGINYNLEVNREGEPLFMAEDVDYIFTGLSLDQSLSDIPINQFDFERVNHISVTNYDLYLPKIQHIFKAGSVLWEDKSSTFSIDEISFHPLSENVNQYDVEIPSIVMSGINLKKVLKESYYDGESIVIERPSLNLKLAQGKGQKTTNLDLGFIPIFLRNRYLGAKANSFEVRDAYINMQQAGKEDSIFIEAEKLDFFVDSFEVDSTMEMVPNRFLFANDVQISGDYLSMYQRAKSDFYNVNHFALSTKDGDIWLNGLYYAINTREDQPDRGRMKVTLDDLHVVGMDFFKLTQKKTLDIDEILMDDANIIMARNGGPSGPVSTQDSMQNVMQQYNLINTDTSAKRVTEKKLLDDISKALEKQLKENQQIQKAIAKKPEPEIKALPFDTTIIKKIEIDRIMLSDSRFNYEDSDNPNTGLLVPDIWLLVEDIQIDPLKEIDSSRIFYSDNIMAKVSNFKYVLPDNLSEIRSDELLVDSRDSSITAKNVGLIPLASKYDFGIAKGFQSTWMQVLNDSIKVNKVDFLGLLNDNKFTAQSLEVYQPDFSIFRDKRNPFPEWQRKPLPQVSLREMDFKFALDTVRMIDAFVSYQEHAEKGYTPGEVFFSDLNATVINASNDSLRIMEDKHLRIGATARVFDAGAIKAEFMFDLLDLENIHSYGVDVEPFDLTEFNRILIPTAFVQISSGKSNKIIMTAKANNLYSYGEMKFYYEDLKIQLLKRETELPEGFGNALGSFFANTFIIRSNNPRNLFLRKGDIFFERDKKRAIFNYWTKTFLSGVVSSIGATNNKKKIKKMQNENLKKIEEEKRQLSSL